MSIGIAAIGECMLELTHLDDSTLSLGYGGDTLNTATYLARLGGDSVTVDYVTRLGADWYSDQMVASMEDNGIGTSLIEHVADATPGLYLVRTDPSGERSFTYHRSGSPARSLFGPQHSPELDHLLTGYDVLYLSAITLQILTPLARRRLWNVLDAQRRRGGLVAFDTNYRPAGWQNAAEARDAIEKTLGRTDYAFPTFDDEHHLFGDPDPTSCAARIAALGVREIVIKNGADGCLVHADGKQLMVPAQQVTEVVDTTGAGDSFNAGYLAARLVGQSPQAAALAGHYLAAEVIRWHGAIIPRDATTTDPAEDSAR